MIYHEVEPGCVFDFCSLLRIFLVAGRLSTTTSMVERRGTVKAIRRSPCGITLWHCQRAKLENVKRAGTKKLLLLARGENSQNSANTHTNTHTKFGGFFPSLHTKVVVENVAFFMETVLSWQQNSCQSAGTGPWKTSFFVSFCAFF